MPVRVLLDGDTPDAWQMTAHEVDEVFALYQVEEEDREATAPPPAV